MTAARSMWVARHDQSIDRWITGSPPIAGLTATADPRWWLACRRRDTYSFAAAKVDGPRIRFTSSSSNPARGQIKGKATTRAETHRLRKEIKQHPGTGKNTRDAREKEKHGSGAESTRTTRRCCLARNQERFGRSRPSCLHASHIVVTSMEAASSGHVFFDRSPRGSSASPGPFHTFK